MRIHTLVIAFAMALGTGKATIINEPFDSASGSIPPSGWSFVDNAGSSTYSTTTGNPGNAGTILSSGSGALAQAYILNGTEFDLTQSLTVTFDAMIASPSNYDSSAVMFGDILGGLTGSANQLLSISFGRNNFGNDDPEIRDGSGTVLTPAENQQKMIGGTWHPASFTWTPTSGTTGDLSFTMTGTQNGSIVLSAMGFTFASNVGYVAFGDLDTINGANFDNITLNGTATVVPEPSTTVLLGLGLLGLLARRRRKIVL